MASRTPSRSERDTLPDWLREDLHIVSIGINPSPYSVSMGFPFARPGNRFWPVLNASGLVAEQLTPGRKAIDTLFREHHFGFTDIVKRPTRTAKELTREDYRTGALELARKLRKFKPLVAWFQGVEAWKMFRLHAMGLSGPVTLGPQVHRPGDAVIFVTPNPSGANPAANPEHLLPWFVELKTLRDRLVRARS